MTRFHSFIVICNDRDRDSETNDGLTPTAESYKLGNSTGINRVRIDQGFRDASLLPIGRILFTRGTAQGPLRRCVLHCSLERRTAARQWRWGFGSFFLVFCLSALQGGDGVRIWDLQIYQQQGILPPSHVSRGPVACVTWVSGEDDPSSRVCYGTGLGYLVVCQVQPRVSDQSHSYLWKLKAPDPRILFETNCDWPRDHLHCRRRHDEGKLGPDCCRHS